MEKDFIKTSLLYDFYKGILSEKQKEAIDLYYNNDLSLSEIAENMGITRQGVRDNIKRGEKMLYETEKKLGLYERFLGINKIIQDLRDCANALLDIEDLQSAKKISDKLNLIAKEINQLN